MAGHTQVSGAIPRAAHEEGTMLRGALPTFITEREMILCKVAPRVLDTYEVRLCLFMAVERGLRFVLAVRPGATVDAPLEASIREAGGVVVANEGPDFAVSVSALDASGAAQETWVLGDDQALAALHEKVASEWLTRTFVPGAVLAGEDLTRLRDVVRRARFALKNVDDEDVRTALLDLMDAALLLRGAVCVQ